MTDIPLNDGELFHLGDPDGAVVVGPSHEDLIAQIPDGMPVKMVVDVATNSYRYEALTPDEVALREVDAAAAAEQSAITEQATADREALVAKLTAGKATEVEMQQALAKVLGQ